MKAPAFHLVGLLLASVAFAAASDTPSAPQPRARLNPNGGSVSLPPPASTKPAATPAVLMEKYVVRQTGTGLKPTGPTREPQPIGVFRPLEGGRIFRTNLRGVRAEVGLWPWDDVFAEDAKFKAPRTRVDVDFVRVKW